MSNTIDIENYYVKSRWKTYNEKLVCTDLDSRFDKFKNDIVSKNTVIFNTRLSGDIICDNLTIYDTVSNMQNSATS